MAIGPKRRLRMQVRATPERGAGTGTALISTYELEYEIGWGWTEQIMPGCFGDSIAAHPTIPIFYNHGWGSGPIGSGQPTEDNDKKQLTVDFRLYLQLGDLVDRVYQAMLDEALEEWSIGFWAEAIDWSKDNPECDNITQGDLAEGSICVRGANPETGTLDLAGRKGWLMGEEEERKQEVSRLRSRYNVPDLSALSGAGPGSGSPSEAPARRRAEGDMDDDYDPADLAQSVDALIDQVKVLLEAGDAKGALDLIVAADCTVDQLLEALGVPDDDEIEDTEDPPDPEEDPADDESARKRFVHLIATPSGRELLARTLGPRS